MPHRAITVAFCLTTTTLLVQCAPAQQGAATTAAATPTQTSQPAALPQLPVTLELISDNVSDTVIHGWNTSRLVKYHGIFYASGILPNPGPGSFWDRQGVFFRRTHDGHWLQAGMLLQNPYTMLVGPDGRFWTVAPSSYSTARVYRMKRPLEFSSFQELYNGTCSYLGASVDAEGNFLLLHAEGGDYTANVPNAVIAAFYERETDRWFKSRIETPEGRYGYEGIVLKGRRALAVLNSAIADPEVNRTPPHYNWRHIRLARCEDLTKGEWTNVGWHMPRYGNTTIADMMEGPDGNVYLTYIGNVGDTYEEMLATPYHLRIARVGWDMSSQIFEPGVSPNPARLYVSSRGGWFLVGALGSGKNLRLWKLDPGNGFRPAAEWELTGTDKLQGYVIHTLRPERFGGEDDGDTIHLLSAEYVEATQDRPRHAKLWHACFELPE